MNLFYLGPRLRALVAVADMIAIHDLDLPMQHYSISMKFAAIDSKPFNYD